MAWTNAQEQAMNERGRTLLVSAAAGSGKTAVLTQRIIRILTEEHGEISRMLIVTFTRAAAGELRERISQALSKALALDPGNTHLSKQLMMLGGAHISTIDSFYLDLVKSHFQEANFPPAFRLADESELKSLRSETMDGVVDAMLRDEPDFVKISDLFCTLRQESSLTTALIDIAGKLNKYPESIDILLRSADEIEAGANTPLHTKFGKVWLETVKRYLDYGNDLFKRALQTLETEVNSAALKKRFFDVYNEMSTRMADGLSAIAADDYDKLRLVLSEPLQYQPTGGKYPEMSELLGKQRLLCAKFRSEWVEKAVSLGAFSPEEICASAAESAALLRLLHKALRQYSDAYLAAKQQREIAEFSDISRAAYLLLVEKDGSPTPLAREIAEAFDAIYIDEYQDVDAMQDATFRAISKPDNRFMVGDIKQSIYRFRGAQPAVFANYRKTFPSLENASPDDKNAMVFMSDCFRCDENIIKFSNTVSGFLFSRHAESIGYSREDDLNFSKEKPQSLEEPLCHVMVLDRHGNKEDDEESPAALELEAEMIANEIARLLSTGFNAGGGPITPKDIAVLMRKSSLAKPLAQKLNERNIPTNDTSSCKFFESPEVLCMYSLLATIDNPFRDVYLAATLRSPFFGFSLEDLVTIRSAGSRALSLYESLQMASDSDAIGEDLLLKITDFLTRLGVYREKAQSLSVDKLIRYLYHETAILAFGDHSAAGGRGIRQANLWRLYEYARTFEISGFKGLYQFIRYVDDIMANGTKMPAPDGDPNAVSLITIHHSKGLQYPVCFIAGTGSMFNNDDTKPQLLADEHLGCATRLCNAGPFSRANTFFRQAIELEIKRQNREEEMRVLYVAMTRAKERLYVTGVSRGDAQKMLSRAELHAEPEASFFATSASSLLEWILTALAHHGDYSSFAKLSIIREDELDLREWNEYIRNDLDDEEEVEYFEDEDPSLQLYLYRQKEDVTAFSEKAAEDGITTALDAAIFRKTVLGRFDYVYPHRHLTNLPAKLSVSKLSPEVLDVFDADAATEKDVEQPQENQEAEKEAKERAMERLLHTFDRTPCFEKKKISAAQRGTATHEFLQFCDFKKAKADLRAELDRLITAGFLPKEYKAAIRINELERFFKSAFFASLEAAKELRRETRFHIFLPADRFTQKEALARKLQDEKIAVQGVIDLFFVDSDGKLILCDYKTDRLTDEELRDPAAAAAKLREHHGEQLSYYAQALFEICGRRPDKILIYSLPLGEAVEIELAE